MGYIASYSGYIVVKKDRTDSVLKMLEEADIFENLDVRPHILSILDEIDVSGHGNYYGDYLEEIYGKISPYVVDAEIEFFGDENDSHWKHIFEDGEWKERQGRIVYDDESYTFAKAEKDEEGSFEERSM